MRDFGEDGRDRSSFISVRRVWRDVRDDCKVGDLKVAGIRLLRSVVHVSLSIIAGHGWNDAHTLFSVTTIRSFLGLYVLRELGVSLERRDTIICMERKTNTRADNKKNRRPYADCPKQIDQIRL